MGKILDSLLDIGGKMVPGFGAVTGAFQGAANLRFQKEKLAYDKQLQQTIFDREDTGVQRRADDMRAAGINPLLAAGSAAQAGAVVKTEAPDDQRAAATMDGLRQGFEAMQMQKTIAQTAEQTKLIKQKQIEQDLINEGKRIENDYASKVNPINISQKTEDLKQALKANPYKVTHLAQQVRESDIDITNKGLDTLLKQNGIDLNEIKITREKLGVFLDQLGIFGAQRDLTIKALTIAQKRLENTQYERNMSKWDLLGLPSTGQGFPGMQMAGSMVNNGAKIISDVGTGAKNLWNKITGKGE